MRLVWLVRRREPGCRWGAGGGDGGADGAAADAGDAASACAAETCVGEGPSCFFADFGSCTPDIFNSGDWGATGVIGECKGGKLHVAATDTHDMTAVLSHDTPDTYDKIRISTSLAVGQWEEGPVLRVGVDGVLVAELDTVTVKSGRPSFTLCGEVGDGGVACATPAFEPNRGELHRFTFVITRTSVSLSVDCVPLATRMVHVVLGPHVSVAIGFGKVDASPIDGTLDDLSVSFP